jgi:hypothetical protein
MKRLAQRKKTSSICCGLTEAVVQGLHLGELVGCSVQRRRSARTQQAKEVVDWVRSFSRDPVIYANAPDLHGDQSGTPERLPQGTADAIAVRQFQLINPGLPGGRASRLNICSRRPSHFFIQCTG